MEIEFEKYIKNTKEIKELGNAYKFIFDKIENEGQVLLNNQFILSADEYVVKEWENWLEIPFDSSLTLEERRQQILLKINMKPPYTFNNMKKQIYAFTGIESDIEEDRANLVITIDLTGASNGAKKLVKQYMDKIKPVNVVYNIINKQAILYNQYHGIAITTAQIINTEFDGLTPASVYCIQNGEYTPIRNSYLIIEYDDFAGGGSTYDGHYMAYENMIIFNNNFIQRVENRQSIEINIDFNNITQRNMIAKYIYTDGQGQTQTIELFNGTFTDNVSITIPQSLLSIMKLNPKGPILLGLYNYDVEQIQIENLYITAN